MVVHIHSLLTLLGLESYAVQCFVSCRETDESREEPGGTAGTQEHETLQIDHRKKEYFSEACRGPCQEHISASFPGVGAGRSRKEFAAVEAARLCRPGTGYSSRTGGRLRRQPACQADRSQDSGGTKHRAEGGGQQPSAIHQGVYVRRLSSRFYLSAMSQRRYSHCRKTRMNV